MHHAPPHSPTAVHDLIYTIAGCGTQSPHFSMLSTKMETRLSLVLAVLVAVFGMVANALTLPSDALKDNQVSTRGYFWTI